MLFFPFFQASRHVLLLLNYALKLWLPNIHRRIAATQKQATDIREQKDLLLAKAV